ncbi:MAG: single-stranded-DNA-specific exonuclease RecJ [Planctomycetaceae bacterium]
MAKVWRYSTHDESLIKQLSQRLRVSPLLAQVLSARGYQSADQASEFLTARLADLHDPELLPGISEASDRVLSALQSQRRITIYGDYDVDGVTATSLLYECLRLAGGTVDYYIPSRMEEGYGLNSDAIRKLSQEDPQRLMISVDCGISSVDVARVAQELGLELIITDHHQMADVLPAAACLVHPRLPGSTYPFPDLCGAGVAFKLAWAICQKLGDGKRASPRMREFLKTAVGLTALGTVADVVPLRGENRVIVRYGLQSLVAQSTPGLQSLLQVCEIGQNSRLRSDDIGFKLAPRINAAGRLGQARLAVELLTTQDAQRGLVLAKYLDELNKTRQSVERKIFKQAKELVADNPAWKDHASLVLSHEKWHPGVIGIVANRVAEHFEKPTVLIAEDRQAELHPGSGRSFAGFNLHSGFVACGQHLESYGGHHAAAGLKIRSELISDFRQALHTFTQAHHSINPSDLELQVDAEVRLADVTYRAVCDLDRLGPFGAGNRQPLFVANEVNLDGPPQTMGEGGRHLSLQLTQYGTRLRAIAFGKGDWADALAKVQGPIAISFQPSINSFRGRESVQLQLVDWQPESATAAVSP